MGCANNFLFKKKEANIAWPVINIVGTSGTPQ